MPEKHNFKHSQSCSKDFLYCLKKNNNFHVKHIQKDKTFHAALNIQ